MAGAAGFCASDFAFAFGALFPDAVDAGSLVDAFSSDEDGSAAESLAAFAVDVFLPAGAGIGGVGFFFAEVFAAEVASGAEFSSTGPGLGSADEEVGAAADFFGGGEVGDAFPSAGADSVESGGASVAAAAAS